jgi:hypothetical protein
VKEMCVMSACSSFPGNKNANVLQFILPQQLDSISAAKQF